MPWKDTRSVEQRIKFIEARLSGELIPNMRHSVAMYKWWHRLEQEGRPGARSVANERRGGEGHTAMLNSPERALLPQGRTLLKRGTAMAPDDELSCAIAAAAPRGDSVDSVR
jgi:hypothetical protein